MAETTQRGNKPQNSGRKPDATPKPNENGSGGNRGGNHGNGESNSQKFSSLRQTAEKLEKGLDVIAKAATVAKLINDPKWYSRKDVPGGIDKLVELTRNEQTLDVADPYQLTLRTNLASLSATQIAVLDVHITHGTSEAFKQVVDRIFQKFETDARYTCPFTRQDLGLYIKACCDAMIKYSTLLHAIQITNLDPAGDAPIQGEMWAALLNQANVTPIAMKTDIASYREVLLSEVRMFDQFMRHNICYDGPIMSKLFLDGLVLWADSEQSDANLVKIRDLIYRNQTTDNVATDGAPRTYASVYDIITDCQTFRMDWPQINSTIAAKLDQMKLAKFVEIDSSKYVNTIPAVRYSAEVNAQLRNAVIPAFAINGKASGDTENRAYSLPINKCVMAYQHATNGVGTEPQAFLVPSTDVAADSVAVYSRIGGNHVTMISPGSTVKFGVVSTDDWKLDSEENIQSALLMVPITEYPPIAYSGVIIYRGSAFIPYNLHSYREDQFGSIQRHDVNEAYSFRDVNYPNVYLQISLDSLQEQFADNWLNAPIYDSLKAVVDSTTPSMCEWNNVSMLGDFYAAHFDPNTGYQKVYAVTAEQLRGIKYKQEYSLFMVSAI